MTTPQLSHVVLRVADLERASAFWSGLLGLPLVGGGGAFVFLDAGGPQIALNETEGGDPTAASSTTEVVLEVEDPRSTHQAWQDAGVDFEVEMRSVMEHEGRALLAAHFRDPDGHLVSLTGWAEEGADA